MPECSLGQIHQAVVPPSYEPEQDYNLHTKWQPSYRNSSFFNLNSSSICLPVPCYTRMLNSIFHSTGDQSDWPWKLQPHMTHLDIPVEDEWSFHFHSPCSISEQPA